MTAGPGCCVAAWIVVYDVSRNDVWSSENTTNAEPTDGAPAWSSVLTNHTDGRALSSRPVSVEPLAANFCSSSSWFRISCFAVSPSPWTTFFAASSCSPKPPTKLSTLLTVCSWRDS